MTIKIKCMFCKRIILKPKVNQLTCDRPECKRIHQREYMKIYREMPGNREANKEYHKEYRKRPEVIRKNKKYQKKFQSRPENKIKRASLWKAMRILKNKHPREFNKIYQIIVSKEKLNGVGADSKEKSLNPPLRLIELEGGKKK